MWLANMAKVAKLAPRDVAGVSGPVGTGRGDGRVDVADSPRRLRRGRRSRPAVDPAWVDPAEVKQLRDELTAHMERVRREHTTPPGAFALFDHFMRVTDRVLRGTSYRREVELLIEASEQISKWREAQGHDPSRYVAARDHTLDVLHRVAATLPEKPPRAAAPDNHAAWSLEAMTMTVDAFAHAIGKSPRTVYRMACNGQLLVHRDGVGRGTVLIYRDQVDPANRPRLVKTAKRLRQPAPLSVARSS